MIAPLHLVELELPSPGKTNLLFEDSEGKLPIGQVLIYVQGTMVNILENFGFVGDLQALAEKRDMEHIMEICKL